MRIVILGDFHIDGQHPELTEKAMEDVAQVSPDLVVPLGDFGRNGLIGRPEGLWEAKRYLDRLEVPLRPIMGNHDLERESGGKQPPGTMNNAFMHAFDLSEPYGVLEFAEWRLFFASTEPQPADSCYDVQECYATDRQFETLVTKLKERPGVPAVFFTHAPPIGSGLRTVPRVHVRSTNAYLDQNHDPYRWLELVRRFPEIVMWFSAHYHLSHRYPNSHTVVQGTHFFLTGVHSSCTRDGKRQSRVLDIGPDGASVRTLDHAARRMTEEGVFIWQGSPSGLMGHTPEIRPRSYAGQPTVIRPSVESATLFRAAVGTSPAARTAAADDAASTATAALPRLVRECPVGEAASVTYGLAPLRRDRYLVATEDGFSWEAEPETSAVFGTLHIGPPLVGIAATDNTAWLAWSNRLGYSSLSSPWRFVRLVDGVWPEAVHSFGQPVEALAPLGDDKVLAAADGWLWEAAATESGLEVKPVARQPEPFGQLTASDGLVWAVGRSGKLYRLSLGACGEGFVVDADRGYVAAWDAFEGETAALIAAENHYEVEISGTELRNYPIRVTPGPSDKARIVCLGQGVFVFAVQGKAYAGGGRFGSPIPLQPSNIASISAVSRCLDDSRQFAVSGARFGEDTGLLQIWRFPAS